MEHATLLDLTGQSEKNPRQNQFYRYSNSKAMRGFISNNYHLELHYSRSQPEINIVWKTEILHGHNKTCSLILTLLHPGPVVVSERSSGTAPCRQHYNDQNEIWYEWWEKSVSIPRSPNSLYYFLSLIELGWNWNIRRSRLLSSSLLSCLSAIVSADHWKGGKKMLCMTKPLTINQQLYS